MRRGIRTGTVRAARRGSIIPLVLFSLVALCGFVALAVDAGMILLARTQCQSAADIAAMAGARTVDGSPNSNLTLATTNAQNAATANAALSQPIQAAEVSIQHGAYHYDVASQTFAPQFPAVAPDNYNLTQATITRKVNLAFAKVFGLTYANVSATATATHRPRDICILLDYSGSMNNESDLWQTEGYLGTGVSDMSQNTDPVFPQFGWYDPNYSPNAGLRCTSSDPRVGKCNVTQSVLGIPPLVNDFYQNMRGAASTPAFNPASSNISNTNPGGDRPLNKRLTSTPAKNWSEITGDPSIPFAGYASSQLGQFYGYTQGPGYWGKTFFIWPPDPSTQLDGTPNDWRKRFFFLNDGVTPVNDNTTLWAAGLGSAGGGIWKIPPGNYVINYKAILNWIKNTGPNPFPPILRAGNVLYYDHIPDDVPGSAYDHTLRNGQIPDMNQRFWKEYIDFTIGVWRDPLNNNIQYPGGHACSYGGDYTCGSSTPGQYVQITGPDDPSTPDVYGNPFINPTDNPKRPRHRLWFGPMTMIQYLLDVGLLPGTAHDISMIAAKLGIQGALTDIKNNHPNDLVSMILFSRPHYTGEYGEAGQFSQAQYNLSRDYSAMINSLWFPPNSSSSDVRPWDQFGLQTPRAHGDYCANTATSFGFMLAYNQFSADATLRSQQEGGFGRKGAQRLIVLETDGMANTTAQAGFTNSGANKSFYNVRSTDSFSGSDGWGVGSSAAIAVAQRLCALETDTANGPGFATARKPVLIHCVAFGAVFEAAAASASEQGNVVGMLQQISTIGGTVFPSSAADPANGYKWCVGTLDERMSKLRQAFTKVMDDGVAVVLVR